MTNAAPDLVEAKRAFYQNETVAAHYDEQRFGGASGEYLNQREMDIVERLLPRVAVIADIACGTGRLLPLLRARADLAVGLDASAAMLDQASTRGPLVQADAFKLALRDASLDAATAMRLLFHFADTRPLLRELRRVVKPGGMLVCDTCTWSPRGLAPLGRDQWGERVAAISPNRFRLLAEAEGWRVRREVAGFLISPHMYRQAPLPVALALERLEPRLPRQLLCRRRGRVRPPAEAPSAGGTNRGAHPHRGGPARALRAFPRTR